MDSNFQIRAKSTVPPASQHREKVPNASFHQPPDVSRRTIDANLSRDVRLTRLASGRRALLEASCYPPASLVRQNSSGMVRI
jgi:hypothetical protein